MNSISYDVVDIPINITTVPYIVRKMTREKVYRSDSFSIRAHFSISSAWLDSSFLQHWAVMKACFWTFAGVVGVGISCMVHAAESEEAIMLNGRRMGGIGDRADQAFPMLPMLLAAAALLQRPSCQMTVFQNSFGSEEYCSS